MATYTQGIDPRSFQTTGYQLPTNQIIQAVATRNAYWDANASSLKNTYNRNLNLSLTLGQNKSDLQNLMKGVDAGLKKAVQADLSIQPNAVDAMKVFDPVVKNENIQGDHAITTHYQQEMQVADTYRTKDGGKEYSPTNVKDLMIGLDKFAKSNDPNSWKEHYATRRSYTPYYDVQSEINALRKTFKPSITATTTPDVDPKTGEPTSFYMKSVTDKSTTADQWKAYLGANLSDKARTQLGINGRVSYYGNEGALASDYMDYTQNKVANTVKQRDALNGIIKGLPDGDIKNLYIQQATELDDNIKDLNDEKRKLKAGDLSTLRNNQDAIAGLIYSDNYVANVARSLVNVDTEVKFSVNGAAVNYFNQNLEESRFTRSLDLKRDIAEADLQFKYTELATKESAKKAEEQLNWIPGTVNSTELDDKTLNKELYDKQVTQSENALKSATVALDGYLTGLGKDVSSMKPVEREAFMKTWLATEANKNSRAYQNYQTAYDIYHNQKAVRDQIVAEGTAVAKQRYPEMFRDTRRVLDNNSFSTTDGKRITIPDNIIKDAYLGISDRIQFKPDPSGGFTDITYTDEKGVKYDLPTHEATRIMNGVDIVKSRYGASAEKVKEIIEQKVTQSFHISKPDGDQFKNPLMIRTRQGFAREMGLPQNAIEDITVYGRNQFGTFFNMPATLNEEKTGISKSKLTDMVTQKGGRVVTSQGQQLIFMPHSAGVTGSNDIYLNPKLRPIQAYFDQHKAESDNKTVSAPNTINYDPNGIGEAFTFMMVNIGGLPTYVAVHKNTGKQIGPPQGFESLEAADLYLKESAFPTKKAFDEKIKYY